ncbi:MAG: peptidylprolyl isomerase [Leptolyngbya sp. DLM2.Bin15]|nr:MAG: peptidylprolyl isomerase [Leptolyngbya sp. DLM2.Bin15]
MTLSFHVTPNVISSETIISLLEHYHLFDSLLREMIIDQAIAPIELTANDLESCHTEAEGRSLKLQTFKRQRWQSQVRSRFLERSAQLHQVIYSMIRVPEVELADELYFRIQNHEQSFADLAHYSHGTESNTWGLVGPVELGSYSPEFASILAASPPGELIPPLGLDDLFVIVRVEKHIPAQLNDSTCNRLLDELFEHWMIGEIDQWHYSHSPSTHHQALEEWLQNNEERSLLRQPTGAIAL